MSLPLLPLRQQHPELVNQRPDIRSLTASPQVLRAECGKQFSTARCTLKRLALFALVSNGRGAFHFVVRHALHFCAIKPLNASHQS
jgi:hypothetical protein